MLQTLLPPGSALLNDPSIAGLRTTKAPQSAAGRSRVLVVFKGAVRLESSALNCEITESYAAYLPRNIEHAVQSGSHASLVALVDLPDSCDSRRDGQEAAFRIEDSQSYFLLSKLFSSHVSEQHRPFTYGWLQRLGDHLAGRAAAEEHASCHKLTPVYQALETWSHETACLDEMADSVALHPMSLTRKFRRTAGCSMGEYRQRVRAERAFYRVIKSAMPLSELSLVCGYADQSHLTRSFQRFFNLTPGGLRSHFSQLRVPA